MCTCPVQISGLNSVIALGGRGYHALAIEADGSVWGWGWNNAGELGEGTTNRTTVPVRVAGLTNPAAVSAGYKFSIALMPNGTVFQWGHGRVIADAEFRFTVGDGDEGGFAPAENPITPMRLVAMRHSAARLRTRRRVRCMSARA